MFGSISTETFLAEYWQQKPLLVRQAFPDFQSFISPNELAGLACETDASRIILEKGGSHPWEVRHGAFEEEDFANLPESHWTLLVNDTEQHLEELKHFMEAFRFLPDWRIDDLMISFAVPGGSVGPHVDEYDVFLVQAEGKRRWQICSQAPSQDNFIPDIELRIMQHFQAEQEWVLEPGDMLYLPPNVPHYGVAVDNCLTYSVGFRAPSAADLLENLLDSCAEIPQLQQRFSDKQRQLQNNPGKLSTKDLQALNNLLKNALSQNPQQLSIWLGKYLTTPKRGLFFGQNSNKKSVSKTGLSTKAATLYKSPDARIAYFCDKNEIYLFANGNLFILKNNSKQNQYFVEKLSQSNTVTSEEHYNLISIPGLSNIMKRLQEIGVFLTKK